MASRVDGCLDGDVSCRFELEIAPLRLGREVGVECALDIDRACVMPFDQVAVVAVHAAHEIADGSSRAGRQAPSQAGRILSQREGEVA